MMRRLAVGERKPQAPETAIRELAEMAGEVPHAGEQLRASEESRLQAQRTLELVLESTTEASGGRGGEPPQHPRQRALRAAFWPAGRLNAFAEFNQRVHPDDLARVRHLRLSMADDSAGDFFEAEYRYAGDAQGNYAWLLSRGKVIERDEQGRGGSRRRYPCRYHPALPGAGRAAPRQSGGTSRQPGQSRFLSSMSHELRTPLNAIHGFAQLIELEAQDHAERNQEAEYAREIVLASRHLTSLVDDILDLSSIESPAAVAAATGGYRAAAGVCRAGAAGSAAAAPAAAPAG